MLMRLILVLAFLLPSLIGPTFLPEHAHSIVQLYNRSGSGGTGYEISYKGHEFIMTNEHVCELKDKNDNLMAIATYLPPTKVHVVRMADPEGLTDLCLVEPLKGKLTPLLLGDQELTLFEHFYVSGYPSLGPLKASPGIADREIDIEIGGISFLGMVLKKGTLRTGVVSKLEIEPGSSGSPVFNDKGLVVGTVFAGNDRGMGLFVPLHLMKELLDEELSPKSASLR